MPTKKHVITFLADDDLLKQIDDYRRSQDSIPSRSEAVRILVEKSLNTPDPKKEKTKKREPIIVYQVTDSPTNQGKKK